MYKTTSYIVLLLFCAQALVSGIDVHTLEKGGGPVDIVHHYIDTHSKPSHCDIDEDTISSICFEERSVCVRSDLETYLFSNISLVCKIKTRNNQHFLRCS